MITMKRGLLVLASVAAACTLAAVPSGIAATQQPGPLDVTGEINGAPFRIIVPATWNGKLLVFAHGYVDKADHPGEVDQRPTFPAPSPATATALLGQGWALAATAYKDNGWAVKEALDDLVALTSYFKDNVARPEHTYLWGFSMGSVPTLRLAERNGGAFDGYIAGCSVSAGTPRGGDWLLATMLAYDVTFGEPASWGTPGNVRDDIDFDTEVLPVLLGQLANFGKFEFIRLVAGTPGRGLVVPPPPAFFPGWVFQDFFFATEAGAELERRAGGPVVQNLTHTYTLTPAETTYLASLGVDAGPLLAAMNARRNIAAPPSSRNYVERYAEFDGTIKKPVIALHTEIDGLVPVSHVSAYEDTIEAAGTSDLLFQAYTTGVGHCAFSTTQLVTTVTELDAWVESGVKPTNADFPASQGFDQGFVPPAWLQP
jgi:dienelactone hydrolase